MSYAHNHFQFAGGFPHAPFEQHIDYGIPAAHPPQFRPPIAHHPHAVPAVPYPPHEYHEFYYHAVDDYDDYTENLTRPRLTKEQVDTLEAQFRHHPKPNSDTKRQLALQTNLTLPRVANWFQNRRAKAKQQKRQEEFERMQALTKGEQFKGGDAAKSEDQEDGKEEKAKEQGKEKTEPVSSSSSSSTTPTQEKPHGSKTPKDFFPTSSRQDSAVKREPDDVTNPLATAPSSSLQETATGTTTCTAPQPAYVSGEDYSSVAPSAHTSGIPLPPSAEQAGGAHLAAGLAMPVSAPTVWDPLQNPDAGLTQQPGVCQPDQQLDPNLGFHPDELWLQGQNPNEQHMFPGPFVPPPEADASQWMHMPMANSLPHNDVPFTTEQLHPNSYDVANTNSHVLTDERRGSCASEQQDLSQPVPTATSNPATLDNQPTPENVDQISQLSSFASQRDRRVDLAARRKRPRPAAIGIASTTNRPLLGPSSNSPTTRNPSTSAQSLRHVKSTHNIGSGGLSPRYSGIRKPSAPLRSPLGVANNSNFESAVPSSLSPGLSSGLSSSDMTVPSLVATSMAPPTPLTPEDLQYLLPPTPNDGQYCFSPSADVGFQGWYSATQSMPLHVQSPPTTPLHPQLMSHMQYQAPRGPLSAPPQRTTFDVQPIPEVPAPPKESLWHPAQGVPATKGIPEQTIIQMPQPVHISPVTHGETFVDPNMHLSDQLSGHVSSSPCSGTNSTTPQTNASTDHTTPPGPRDTEFLIHEFPQQEEAHRLAAQHIPAAKLKNYTFTNHTPVNF